MDYSEKDIDTQETVRDPCTTNCIHLFNGESSSTLGTQILELYSLSTFRNSVQRLALHINDANLRKVEPLEQPSGEVLVPNGLRISLFPHVFCRCAG